MANLGKSLPKLLSPGRCTSFSVSPTKCTEHSQVKSTFGRKALRCFNTGDANKGVECTISHKNTLQIPKNEGLLITSPITKKLAENGAKDINCKHIIGRGRFGTVIKGLYKDNPVAVKIVLKENNLKKELKEENAMKLSHPNIIRVFKTFLSQENYGIVMMEYCNGNNMLQKINNPSLSLDIKQIIRYAIDLGHALEYCHRNKIIHLDVKPENIIIDKEDHCKLCDFGSSRLIDNEKGVNAPWPGTPAYAAPEVLQGNKITCNVDVYSFGITLWQLLSREIPYNGEEIHTIIYKVVTQAHRPRKMTSETKEQEKYIQIYEECWRQNSMERPNAKDAVSLLLQI